MYTDASKNQVGVGAAVIWNNTEFLYKLPSSCSIFTAESFAIIKALDLITEHHLQDTIIFTDSLSAINNIKNTYNPSDIGLQIQNKIYTLRNTYNYKIKLFWIPGHSNIIENEHADLAAKTAITSTLSSCRQIISSRDIQKLITNKCQLKWQQKWSSYSTKLNQIKHNIDNWTFPLEIHRKFEVILTRLRIGHTHISHSFLMAKEEPPICTACGVQVTIKHILTECRIYHNTRKNIKLPESLAEILNNHPQSIANIIQFITISNLYTKI
jgi:ribonuclease HI